MDSKTITWSMAFAAFGYETRRFPRLTFSTHKIFSIKFCPDAVGLCDDATFWPPPKGTKLRNRGRKGAARLRRRAPPPDEGVSEAKYEGGHELGDDEAAPGGVVDSSCASGSLQLK